MNVRVLLPFAFAALCAVGCTQQVAEIEEPTAAVEALSASDKAIEAKIRASALEAGEFSTETDDTYHFVKVTGQKRVTKVAVRAILATAGADVTDQLGTTVAAAQIMVEDFDFTTPPEDGEDLPLAQLTDTLRANLTGVKCYTIAQKLSPVGDHGGFIRLFIGRTANGTMMGVYAKGAAT